MGFRVTATTFHTWAKDHDWLLIEDTTEGQGEKQNGWQSWITPRGAMPLVHIENGQLRFQKGG